MPVYQAAEFKKVLKQVQEGQCVPVYLLYGERYLCQCAVKDLISSLIPERERSTNLHVMEGDKEDIYRLAENLKTFPFFGRRQVFVLKDTRLFSSKSPSSSMLSGSHEQFLQGNLEKAAELLLQGISFSGLSLRDVQDGASRNFSGKAWKKILGPDVGGDTAWIEQVVEFAIGAGMKEIVVDEDRARVLQDVFRQGIPAANHLIMSADTVDKRLSLYTMVETMGVVASFETEAGPPSAAKRGQDVILRNLIKDISARHGRSLEPSASSSLIERIGFNPAYLAGTLEKLINYAGERKAITKEDVEAIVGQEREEPIYELTKAFGDKSLELTLVLLGRLLEQGFAPLQILAVIVKHVRRLLLARWALDAKLNYSRGDLIYDKFTKSLPDLKRSKKIPQGLEDMSPYPLFLLLRQATEFQLEQLIEAMSDLMKIDIALKSGGPEPRLLLEDFIMKHISPAFSRFPQ